MELRSKFAEILERAERGENSSLECTINGEIYLRNFRCRERLLLLGGGHICQPLCSFASALDFSVTVADDRPSFVTRERFPDAGTLLCDSFPAAIRQFGITEQDYVAVITRGHRWDADCLRTILSGTAPEYLGMIGSRHRTAGLLNLLEQEGFPSTALRGIHAPIGLEIGALTVKEIAISILAELIACRRADTKRRSNNSVLVTENIDLNLLRFLADSNREKALLLVYETSGSTPVKSGAMMAVDRSFQTAGTIGGGCSENAVLKDAYHLIGTGKQRGITIDMSNDVAEEEGMVCGGQMKVLIKDVGEA